MMKTKAVLAVLGVFLGTVVGVSAFAQGGPTGGSKNQPQPSTYGGPPPGQSAGQTSQEEEASPNFAPVLWITSVEALRSTHGPTLDLIRVRGITSTEGWESGELVPLTKGTPADGMLDLAFIAQAPTDSTAPSKSPGIEAVFTIEPGHPFTGVRVHGATNRVTLKSIPGYAEAPPPPNDCTECVGKYYVGKGESLPAGVSADNVVHEEDLPKSLHVVKATEGLGKLEPDPNRLTLLLDENGRIVIAVWD
jgi:hypothetical protein